MKLGGGVQEGEENYIVIALQQILLQTKHVVPWGEMGNAYTIFIGKLQNKTAWFSSAPYPVSSGPHTVGSFEAAVPRDMISP
jgi:hypothetical protein